MATTFVTPRELSQLHLIEKVTKRKMARKPVPTINEAVEGQQRIAVEKLMSAVENGGTRQYKEIAETLLQENDSVTLLSAALKPLTKETDAVPVKLSEEAPLRVRKTSQPKARQGGYRGSHEGYKGRKTHPKRHKQAKKIS